MTLRFERGGWIVDNDTLRTLNDNGYTAAGICDGGVDLYVLYRSKLDGGLDIIYETQDQEQLNRFVKLLLGGHDEDASQT